MTIVNYFTLLLFYTIKKNIVQLLTISNVSCSAIPFEISSDGFVVSTSVLSLLTASSSLLNFLDASPSSSLHWFAPLKFSCSDGYVGVKTASSVTTINNGKETFYVHCKLPAGQVLQPFKEYEFKVCLFSHITYFCEQRCGDILAGASDVSAK